MREQNRHEQDVRDIFAVMKQHKEPYTIDVLGEEPVVFPDVFSPKYFTDSEWFAKHVPAIVGEGKLLEIGTATGIVALFAALHGARVIATDISHEGVENAKENFRRHRLDVAVYEGDMYEPLPEHEKFDFIFWNHPFNKSDTPEDDVLLQAGFDVGYSSLRKYFAGAKKRLNPGGKLLLGSSTFALTEEIEALASENGFIGKIIVSEELPIAANPGFPNEYRIYEFS